MSIEIRPATASEMGQLGLMGAYSYGGAFGDGPDNVVATGTRPEWTLCAFDTAVRQADGQPTMATSFSAFPFTTRVNGNAVPLAGISTVGTRPEYRRRGLVRKIMTQAFAINISVGNAWRGCGLRKRRFINAMVLLHQVDCASIGSTPPTSTCIKMSQQCRY